ncbi:MAG: glycosyltransferase family 4 protein [Bacteroidales bacterium]|jgi:glycosyltransferase involved in cell wall biosynthesis
MKKICHISTVHDLYDDRIFYKECNSLSESGYDTILIVPSEKNNVINNITIVALPFYKNRYLRFFIGNAQAFIKSLKTKSNIFHFHDPELMFLGVLLKCFGKKVIYDIHEDVSKQMLYKDWIKMKFTRKLASLLIYAFEQFCCLFYNCIITATEDISKKFPKHKTIVIRNFPILKLINNSEIDKKDRPFICVYAGGLSRIRGIKEIIEAIGIIDKEIELWLFGKFDNEEYFEECKKTIGWKNVKYRGFIKMNEVYNYIAQSDVGLSTLYPIKNYLTSLPVKAFEYMAHGKPVIMSDFPYWKEVFKDCALFVNPYNSSEIAKCISVCIDDKLLLAKLGNNGRNKVLTEYSWENESKKLINLYKKI